jgi:hypothetical protein
MNSPDPRIQNLGKQLKEVLNHQPPHSYYDFSDFTSKHSQPVVNHEIGQWCAYPNFKETEKYDGVLKARNFEIFRETLKDNGMAHLADSFLLASGKLHAPVEVALCGFSTEIKPIVRIVDDWFANRPLALISEAKAGKGKLLISGIDFMQNFENRPEAKELLFSLKKHLVGNSFNPTAGFSINQIQKLF